MWIQYTTRLSSLAVLLLLAGCSASWKAPLESHDGGYSRSSPRGSDRPISGRFYKVRRGDTLYAIAWRANRDHRSLARWNNIKPPYLIYPGQILRLVPYGKSSNTRVRKADGERKKTARVAPKPQAPRTVANSRLHWLWPVRGKLLSSYLASDATRKGIKVGGKAGQPIVAAEAGEVVYSGSGLIGYGRLIIIKHNDEYLSAYGHNATLLVKEGDKVKRGKKIATMGRSNDGVAMLHFEIRRDGKPIDPMGLLPGN